ncbi:DUF3280 domain-containing protein [Methylomonas sp. SURF-2]|uniref:DUF3280 domain-containing protein n=1 Tax=Methylomonas subterranea TaxID=2952225 RepID=A0ABT1TBF9_9GAMM|nr:DUF2380 domain-containing protein [Methylomonas sp. SURF-2]MCQ8102802.1 DUF3280 domain-containing protein [Methylomonas sp. SURF-2]
MRPRLRVLAALACLAAGFNAAAKPRIAVLDVELYDTTLLPNGARERQRTAGMRSLLEQSLAQNAAYDIVGIDAESRAAAEAGFGYLFAHHDAAAKLGRRFGADWVLVARHGKPSFLYSDLTVQLIDVNSERLAARYSIELKGNHAAVTQRGVDKLAAKLKTFIAGEMRVP